MYRILAATGLLTLALAASVLAQTPEQANVSVKIIEFQSNDLSDIGLSAYFRRKQETAFGVVRNGAGLITSADSTFPATNIKGLTVFLDRLSNHYGDFEIVLQGLVDQGRATLLSKPNVLASKGNPMKIDMTKSTPYEEMRVFGSSVTPITSIRDTGVMLTVTLVEIVNDDGNLETKEDNFVKLTIAAKVDEEGARVPVALDNRVSSESGNFLSVPQTNSRSIDTTVWVKEGQVLILGGLYLNRKNKDIKTLPWFSQAEDFVNGTIQRVTPFTSPDIPLTSNIGKNQHEERRRELVFVLRADIWRPTYSVATLEGQAATKEDTKKKMHPSDVITGVLGGISNLPGDIAGGISGNEKNSEDVSTKLGDD